MEDKNDSDAEANIEGAWSKEIERRLAEIDTGSVEPIPWEDVRPELFARPNET